MKNQMTFDDAKKQLMDGTPLYWMKDRELTHIEDMKGNRLEAVMIKVRDGQKDLGTLYVAVTPNNLVYMKMDDWRKEPEFSWFLRRMHPRNLISYIMCFLDLERQGRMWWTNEMLDRTKFFNSSLEYGSYSVTSHEFKDDVVDCALTMRKPYSSDEVQCNLSVWFEEGKTHFTLLDVEGNTIRHFSRRMPPWNVPGQLRYMLNHKLTRQRLRDL